MNLYKQIWSCGSREVLHKFVMLMTELNRSKPVTPAPIPAVRSPACKCRSVVASREGIEQGGTKHLNGGVVVVCRAASAVRSPAPAKNTPPTIRLFVAAAPVA